VIWGEEYYRMKLLKKYYTHDTRYYLQLIKKYILFSNSTKILSYLFKSVLTLKNKHFRNIYVLIVADILQLIQ